MKTNFTKKKPMNFFKPYSALMLCLLLKGFISHGQTSVNTTAFPFLLINTDARSGGMGNLGVASSADAFSQYWNPAKYIFSEEHAILGVSHVPNQISAATSLSNLTFYNKGKKRGVWSGAVNYFNYGELNYSELVGGEIVEQGSANPAEWNINVSFSLPLSERFSMGVTTKYIYTNILRLAEGGKGNSGIGFDISGFYQKPTTFLGSEAVLRSGFSLANLGPRINYGNGRAKDFLPTNLRTGMGITFLSSGNNQLSFNFEVIKLLVPNRELVTPATSNSPAVYSTPDVGFISGIFKSLHDAPDGLSGEFNELGWSLGTEYQFTNQFALRAGYFTERPEAGDRKLFTVGAGFGTQNFNCDFSYAFSTGTIQSPLQNTVRFSVTYTLKKQLVESEEDETIDESEVGSQNKEVNGFQNKS